MAGFSFFIRAGRPILGSNTPSPGPLHLPPILVLLPFRYLDPLTHKGIKARHKAGRRELEARYREWEIIGEPEVRQPLGGSFNPWRP